jgi:hypothetical protein
MNTREPRPSSIPLACMWLAWAARQWENEYDMRGEVTAVERQGNAIILTFHDGRQYVFVGEAGDIIEDRADDR